MAITWSGSQLLFQMKQSLLKRLAVASKEGQLPLLPISIPHLHTDGYPNKIMSPHPRSPGGGTCSSSLSKESLPEKNWLME